MLLDPHLKEGVCAAHLINFRLLSVEQNEKRLRLFSALPLSWPQLAVVRLLRMLAPIALTLLLTAFLVLVGLALGGFRFFSFLGSSWALLTALLAFQLLLTDLTSTLFTQVFSAVVIVFLLFNPWAEQFREYVLVPLAKLAETPLGALLALAFCLVFAAADVLVFRRRASL